MGIGMLPIAVVRQKLFDGGISVLAFDIQLIQQYIHINRTDVVLVWKEEGWHPTANDANIVGKRFQKIHDLSEHRIRGFFLPLGIIRRAFQMHIVRHCSYTPSV